MALTAYSYKVPIEPRFCCERRGGTRWCKEVRRCGLEGRGREGAGEGSVSGGQVGAVRTVTIGKVRRLADARHYSV